MLEPFQMAAVMDASFILEREHRGLTWDDVDTTRAIDESNVALARGYPVSDPLAREIVRCTPHTLRRTFASILAAVNLPRRRARYLKNAPQPDALTELEDAENRL